MLEKMWRKGNPFGILLVRMYTDAATVENSREVPQKTKNRMTMWSSNSTAGYISKESENTNLKTYTYHKVHSIIIYKFTIGKIWKQHKCPSTDEWIKKMWHIHIMEYYSAIKRNKTELFVVRWMDLETVIQSEVSQKAKNKYRMLTHIYRI